MSNEISLGDAIKSFLKDSRLNKGMQSAKLETSWEDIVGKTIAKYTDKVEVKGQTLFIHTQVAPLKQELMFQKELILKRVNEMFGENLVKELVIR